MIDMLLWQLANEGDKSDTKQAFNPRTGRRESVVRARDQPDSAGSAIVSRLMVI